MIYLYFIPVIRLTTNHETFTGWTGSVAGIKFQVTSFAETVGLGDIQPLHYFGEYISKSVYVSTVTQ